VHGQSSGRHRRASTAGPGKLALKLGLCLCAGQLIAGPVLASAAEAAPMAVSATTATTKAKVTESVNHRTISYGSAVKVTAKVINPKTGKVATSGKVRLQAWRNHGWRTWQTKSVGKTGYVVFYSKPHITGSYRSLFAGSGSLTSAASGSIKVTVASTGAKVIAEAKRHVGALYLYGAAGPTRFDCSGFTMYVYAQVGVSLPHNAAAQYSYGVPVARDQLEPGDLVFFDGLGHEGIYIGGGNFVHAPHTGDVVKISSLSGWYASTYVGARRL